MSIQYAAADLVPISSLQHFVFCPRQCALIHVEGLWAENIHTAEGRLMHERVDGGRAESRGRLRLAMALPLRSLALGVSGIADLVEFHLEEGQWRPVPVEYKKGARKKAKQNGDQVQLCAQALCLEEMLNVEIAEGFLYYGRERRRVAVTFDAKLRAATRVAALGVHRLLEEAVTPKAEISPKCTECSLCELCLPELPVLGSAQKYLEKLRRHEKPS